MAMFGDPRLPKTFWDKLRQTDNGCWVWRGYVEPGGYPRWRPPGRKKNLRVHRYTYRYLVGPFNQETIDHLCRNKFCCNPEHLEPVSLKENLIRAAVAKHGSIQLRLFKL